MVSFFLNGQLKWISEEEKLIKYLRENENLVSVKNGCNEGACGACMVLIDGKATKSCIVKGKKLEGKNVITIEGLSQKYRKAFAYAFTKAGAVQCGFCIPGMVISAVGLFNKTLNH